MTTTIHRLSILTLLALATLGQPALAQPANPQDNGHPFGSGGSAYFSIGYRQLQHDELNDVFEAEGYPTLDQTSIQYSFGGSFIGKGRWVLDALGGALAAQSVNDADGYELSNAVGWGRVAVGYNVLGHPDLLLYPMLGFGGSAEEVHVREDPFDNQSFAGAVADRSGELQLSRGAFLGYGGVGAEWVPSGKASGFLIGLRVEWAQEIVGTSWLRSDVELAGAPSDPLSGLGAKLKVGWMWHARRGD